MPVAIQRILEVFIPFRRRRRIEGPAFHRQGFHHHSPIAHGPIRPWRSISRRPVGQSPFVWHRGDLSVSLGHDREKTNEHPCSTALTSCPTHSVFIRKDGSQDHTFGPGRALHATEMRMRPRFVTEARPTFLKRSAWELHPSMIPIPLTRIASFIGLHIRVPRQRVVHDRRESDCWIISQRHAASPFFGAHKHSGMGCCAATRSRIFCSVSAFRR